jgi:hypothetical protein
MSHALRDTLLTDSIVTGKTITLEVESSDTIGTQNHLQRHVIGRSTANRHR